MAGRRSQGWQLVLAGVLLVLAALVGRMLFGAQREVARAALAGDLEGRTRHLRRAMAYYLPGNPWVRQAHDELLALARRADRLGNRPQALAAYRELRSAILALRGLSRPFAATLPEVNRAIARLSSADPRAVPGLRGAAGREALLRRLEHPPAPARGWTVLGLGGFGLWVLGGALLLLRGLRPDLSLVRRRFWPLLALVALGLLLFGVGLANA